jgi:hypothetical protein
LALFFTKRLVTLLLCLQHWFQGIVHLLTSRLGDGDRAYRHIYAMRIFNSLSEDVVWLHQDTTMFQVGRCYDF